MHRDILLTYTAVTVRTQPFSPVTHQGTMTDASEHDDDRILIQRFLATKNESDFLGLYDRHADAMYRFAARLCGGPGTEPAEIVQEAWLRAIEGLARFRGDSSLRTWLCAIVRNRWREVRERAGRERRFQVIEGLGTPRSVETPTIAPALERALARLPAGYREVLLLHDLLGYTHEEIARNFGIVEGTSKSQLHRARRALRAELGGDEVVEHGG